MNGKFLKPCRRTVSEFAEGGRRGTLAAMILARRDEKNWKVPVRKLGAGCLRKNFLRDRNFVFWISEPVPVFLPSY